MDHEDDIERLFSWLQTPELRYREFAGAREVADTVVTSRAHPPDRVDPAHEPHPVAEAPPGKQSGQPVASRGSAAGPSGLLGGAYRDSGRPDSNDVGPAEPNSGPAKSQQGSERSLDTVFGRLARSRLPDPRDRPRSVPGSGSNGDRSR